MVPTRPDPADRWNRHCIISLPNSASDATQKNKNPKMQKKKKKTQTNHKQTGRSSSTKWERPFEFQPVRLFHRSQKTFFPFFSVLKDPREGWVNSGGTLGAAIRGRGEVCYWSHWSFSRRPDLRACAGPWHAFCSRAPIVLSFLFFFISTILFQNFWWIENGCCC